MASTVTRSQDNRAPLACAGTGDSHGDVQPTNMQQLCDAVMLTWKFGNFVRRISMIWSFSWSDLALLYICTLTLYSEFSVPSRTSQLEHLQRLEYELKETSPSPTSASNNINIQQILLFITVQFYLIHIKSDMHMVMSTF